MSGYLPSEVGGVAWSPPSTGTYEFQQPYTGDEAPQGSFYGGGGGGDNAPLAAHFADATGAGYTCPPPYVPGGYYDGTMNVPSGWYNSTMTEPPPPVPQQSGYPTYYQSGTRLRNATWYQPRFWPGCGFRAVVAKRADIRFRTGSYAAIFPWRGGRLGTNPLRRGSGIRVLLMVVFWRPSV